jgi:hypothetical protein
MSTTDNSGKEPEQQTQPVAEAGGEGKVDRSVQGTDLRSGFAELRLRCCKRHLTAIQQGNWLAAWAIQSVVQDIDDLSGCEECKQGGS